MEDNTKILEAIEIRKEHKKGTSIEELTKRYNTNEYSIGLIIEHCIYPTKITKCLTERIKKQTGINKLNQLVKEQNESNAEAREFEKLQGIPDGNWKDTTIEKLINELCRDKIKRTKWVIEQSIKSQENYKSIEKLKEAEEIREAHKKGITIEELCNVHKQSKKAIKEIIEHITYSMKVTEKLINKIILEEAKVLNKERNKAKKNAKNKLIKLPKSNTHKEDENAINRIGKQLKTEIKAIDAKAKKSDIEAKRKAKKIVRKNRATIIFNNLNKD